ncbi:MAG: tRNA lysidine(34) synthetase TilS [Actinomycetota bacterium]|nr:tRNA lysidine(34) synthetase TilS [Actinomycetota bacterium]
MAPRYHPPPGPLPSGTGREGLVAEVTRVLMALPAGAGALVALSGGPDSTALAHLVAEARPDLELSLGHVRHGLRDDAADLATVRFHADTLGLPLRTAKVDVLPQGQGLEAAARDARYAALRRLARDLEVVWILLGHTADDQAETLLLRIARGTGICGLAGMAAVHDDLVRPLLRIRRSDIRRFVTLEELATVEDPTNRDPAIRRVRVRQSVLPAFEALAPDPVGALVRLADLARVDASHLEAEAARVALTAVRSYGPARALTTDSLTCLDAALAPRVVRRLLAAVRGTPTRGRAAGPSGWVAPVTAAHVAAVLALQPGQAVDLPGAMVTLGGGWLAAVPHKLPEAVTVPLVVPGSASWPPAGLEIVVVVAGRDDRGQPHLPLGRWQGTAGFVPEQALPPGGDPALAQVVLGGLGSDEDGGLADLVVRSRKPGDRVSTRAGRQKLQDLFVDAGIPRAVRDLVPVVVLGERLLWVPGVAVDARAAAAGRVTPGLQLAVMPSGHPTDPSARGSDPA